MGLLLVLVVAVLALALADGADDNMKGVATLFGSGTTDYKKALADATVTTFAGSLAAFVLARGLVAAFRGEGLVPPQLVAGPAFLAATTAGAAATVLLATRLGIPVSTGIGSTKHPLRLPRSRAGPEAPPGRSEGGPFAGLRGR